MRRARSVTCVSSCCTARSMPSPSWDCHGGALTAGPC
jgi:hypothetical protein